MINSRQVMSKSQIILALAAVFTGVFVMWGEARPLFVGATEVLFAVVGISLLASWPIRRRRAGKALLRLSRVRLDWGAILLGSLVGLFEIIDTRDPVVLALALLAVVNFAMASFIGVRFTTTGVLKFELFVPWSRVRSFRWSRSRLELTLDLERRFFNLSDLMFQTTGTVKVAAQHTEPVAELVTRYTGDSARLS